MVGANVGESENQMGSPNTNGRKFSNSHTKGFKNEETKNLRKFDFTSKVVKPFSHALGPPFIARRRDFYISRLPSNLENILHVNMYKNVFYIM
jgi:hypothetical protein